jgi:hypothetical protein
MLLWLSFVIQGASGLRCASRVMAVLSANIGGCQTTPCWFTGRWWLLKLGYYKLTRPKEKASDWVWIVDHTVKMGPEKCLFILGIRLKDLPRNRALTASDLEPLDLFPVKSSNGDIVYQQLNQAIAKTGVPREILSDLGGDLQVGIKHFLKDHKKSCFIYDIKHKTALVLKQTLMHDKQWITFKDNCRKTNAQLYQTPLAWLASPRQRSKARYMNIEVLITWGNKVLSFLDAHPKSSVPYDYDKINEKLSWLTTFRDSLQQWQHIMTVVEKVESYIRNKGYSQQTTVELECLLNQNPSTGPAQRIKEQLMAFVKQQSANVKAGEILLGSSEIIESLFGKQKSLEGERLQQGFTSLILTIASFVSSTTIQVVEQAMISVKINKVKTWCAATLGQTLQSTKKKAFNQVLTPIVPTLRSAAYPQNLKYCIDLGSHEQAAGRSGRDGGQGFNQTPKKEVKQNQDLAC